MPNFERIPPELKALPQWVAWTLVKRDGKPTKLPVNPYTNDLAKTDDPSTWGTFEQACEAGSRLHGIGFVFTENDPYFGLDMDGHVDSDLIKWFGSYAERSQSGEGAHVIGKAKVGKGRRIKRYEIYDRLRYFVFTGDVIQNLPIVDCQEKVDAFISHCFPSDEPQTVDLSCLIKPSHDDVLERIQSSHQNAKFQRLWAGDWHEYSSRSEADAGLLSILRFWTGGDKEESCRLFSASALAARKKWERQDYRDRTWASIDFGEVYSPRCEVCEVQDFQPIIERKLSPWRSVTDSQIESAIEGTALEPLVRLFEAPMSPKLPIQMSLPKALVMAGCALSGKREDASAFSEAVGRGVDLARVRIDSANGQACNVYALVVAQSGVGKDIGGFADLLSLRRGWLIGTAGSAEGLADVLSDNDRSSGYIAIDEFSTWLDKRHWQSGAASFLTSAFNRGWFSFALSSRGNQKARESRYCFPSILANVQPETLSRYASTIDLSTGFLSRFLVCRVPDHYFGRPVCGSFDQLLERAEAALDLFGSISGSIPVGDNYLQDVCDEFLSHQAAIRSHWSRLVNEYGPRLALMLSTKTPGGQQSGISDIGWERAATVIRWLYSQAESVLESIQEDEQTATRERLLQRILDKVRENGGATTRDITMAVRRGTTRKMRTDAIDELIDRNMIMPASDGRATKYVAVE